MSGAYSSIFIASPILALLKEREPRYVEIRKRLAAFPSRARSSPLPRWPAAYFSRARPDGRDGVEVQ